MQDDAVAGVPGRRMSDDLFHRRIAGQHSRQQDAVVVPVPLGSENGDAVAVRSLGQHLLDGTDGRHAVADDDQMGPFRDPR